MQASKFKLNQNKKREFKLIPRIINPVKISRAVIFAADEQARKAIHSLEEKMPWVQVEVLKDPATTSNYKSAEPTVLMFDDVGMNLVNAEKIRQNNSDIVLALLTTIPAIHCSPPSVARENFPYTAKSDLVFGVNRSELAPENILPAVVKCAEDKLNIEKHSKARRYIFLIVDDEPRWFSQFLPVLNDIIGQRADVMLTRTYEEALKFLFGVTDEAEIDDKKYRSRGHGDDVVCVITDFFFPKGDNLNSDAGKELCNLIKKYYPRIPLIIASKAKEGDDLKDFAFIMPKGDIGSLDILKNYIHDFTGMGNFIIQSKKRNIALTVKNIHQLYDVLVRAETDSELRALLEAYGEKDFFSTWLYMHGFREIGDKLRPKRDKGQRLITILKRYIVREIMRMEYTPLIINGIKITNLNELLHTLRTIDPSKIQYFSDNDLFSIWLDRKGYTELAEDFRPIHGSGEKLGRTLADIVERWILKYQQAGKQQDGV